MKRVTLSTAILAALYSTNPFATELNDVFVSAGNQTQSLKTVTANAHIISATDIQNKQYKTLAEALSQLPGLSAYRSGGLGSNTSVYMRGENTNRLLVLIDGIELNDPTSVAGVHFGNISLNDVERIEVLKGPQSGVWGSGAMSGVVNIITKKGQRQASASLEAGSFNTKKINLTVGESNEHADFVINFSNLTTDGFSAVKPYQASDSGLEEDGYREQEFSMKMGVNLNANNRLQAYIKNSNTDVEIDFGSDTEAPYTGFFDTQLKQLDYTNQTQQFSNRITYQKSEFDADYANGALTKLAANSKIDYAKDQFATVFIDQKTFKNLNNPASDYKNQGVGLTNTNQLLANRLVLSQSIRSDDYDEFDDKVTGNLGAKWQANEGVFVSAILGTAYRAPSLAEIAFNYSGTALEPETKAAYDVTLGLFGLTATYYESEVDNEIGYDTNIGMFGSYTNLAGKSKYQGIELAYQININRLETDLNLNYTKQTAKDANGEWLARRPEQQAALSLDNYSINKLHLGLQTQYIGTQYDEANQQGAQIGRYFKTNLTADYTVSKNMSVFTKISNVFNKDYTQAVAAPRGGVTTPTYVYNNGGRQFTIGLQGKL
ncbi:MAG: TonB-dependent receptor [Thiotrichales bacterium]|nr:TonB-dependent receptor [Thiotrichales bacterium]